MRQVTKLAEDESVGMCVYFGDGSVPMVWHTKKGHGVLSMLADSTGELGEFANGVPTKAERQIIQHWHQRFNQ